MTPARRRALLLAARAQRRVPWGVALTFDVGPSVADTAALAEALDATGVRGTFFVAGRDAAPHAELLRHLVRRGHAVGSRTRSGSPLAGADQERIVEEIDGGRVDVQLALGQRTKLFRPPSGELDGRVALAMWRARLDSWLWSADAVVDPSTPVRERDVVRLGGDTAALDAVAGIVDAVRAGGLDLVAL